MEWNWNVEMANSWQTAIYYCKGGFVFLGIGINLFGITRPTRGS